MARILKIDEIAPDFKRYLIEEPVIASRHRAGQFVIVLLGDRGERIPLTIAASDALHGTVTLVVQEVGKTTMEMGTLRPGDTVRMVGPLGTPTHIERVGTCVCVGGGCGIAPLLPIARAYRDAGTRVAHELVVQGESPEWLELHALASQDEDLLDGIQRLANLAGRLLVEIERRTSVGVDLADRSQIPTST